MNNPAKFARITLNLFATTGRFQISIATGTDLHLVANEYRNLGCIVDMDLELRWLTVVCPVALTS